MALEDNKLNLPKREEEVLKFWEQDGIFLRSLERTKKGKQFVFYEGPPTANGLPGIHHVETRAFKDLIARYKTMRGFFVPRKAGWDTHGLPVELQVEKALGLKNKQEIETYGIAAFNQKAKESVWQYKEEWERLTRRMGFWLDLEHPYITYEPEYMESLWWIISEFWRTGLLHEDFKIVPWCTRCQTGLSTHELAQGYKLVKDKSVFVKFKLDAGQKIGDFVTDDKTYIVAWTTTPWTLPGNVALAVNEKLEYILLVDPQSGERVIVSKSVYYAKKDQGPYTYHIDSRGVPLLKGKQLMGLKYKPLFNVPDLQSSGSYHIYPADFVTGEDGTGVVHTAVMYGEDDYKLGKKVGLPTFHTVDETGHFVTSVKELAGLSAKNEETEKKIISLLQERGNLLAVQEYEHDYPHCWRCGTPLLYYARKAWWVNVTKFKDNLLANNQKINWIPSHLKSGRFGEFLKDVRDWAFSRERYWGTPLPIWKCEACGKTEAIGSIADLRKKSPASRNRYILMRHGESVSNLKQVTSSHGTQHPLTLRGRKQVAFAVRALKKKNIDLMYASPVRRTKETADMIARGLGVKVVLDKRLAEIQVGVLDNRPIKEYHAFFASKLEKFTKRPPEGEHLGDVRARVLDWMEEMEREHKGKTILVVSHEYPLWMLAAGMIGLTNKQTLDLRKGKRKDDFIKQAEMIPAAYVSLPRDEMGEVNLHRPFIDQISFPCAACKKTMKRIPEVADVWFDSGAMPFAQAHAPFEKNQKLAFPADFISEAVDQTRGWFYTLLVVSTLMGKGTPFRNCISLGHVLDKNGQKMSKSKGNVVSPWEMMDKYGVDALRWYFYTVNAPGEPKRFDENDVALRLRSFLGTLWNSYVLFDTYVERVALKKPERLKGGNTILDRWILEKLNALIRDVTMGLDAYDAVGSARHIEEFVINDFSQWYLRRSRRRFQHPETKKEFNGAAETTAVVFDVLVRLTAPFTPFVADVIFRELRKKTGQKESSAHLLSWPQLFFGSRKKSDLIPLMADVRRAVADALKLRAQAGIKVRQPLMTLTIPDGPIKRHPECIELIKDEVNVKKIAFGKETALDCEITPELHHEGLVRELTRNIQEMRRDAGLKPQRPIRIMISGAQELQDIFLTYRDTILRDVNGEVLEFGGKKVFRAEREAEIGGQKCWIGIRF